MSRYDVAIVGAGHNGLVCAAYLAKAGLKVCLVERRPIVGGASITEEVWPGYRVSVAAYWMSMLQPKIMLDLNLRRFGLEVIPTPPAFQPFEDGRSIVFWPETERMVQELRQFSGSDAETYPRFVVHMQELSGYLRKLMFETPVDPASRKLTDLMKVAALAWRFRDIRPKLYELWDLLTLSAHDYLKRWFESDAVLTAFGSYASGSAGVMSPKTQGSAYVLARPYLRDPSTPAGPGGLVKGGMGAIPEALQRLVKELGGTVLTSQTVAKIDIEDGRACGVVLENGERISANIVIANASAKLVYLNLIEHKWLDDAVVDAAKRIRTDSIAYKINLATTALPRWAAYEARGLNLPHPGSVTLAENSDELEEAFQAALSGEMALRPYLWITTPSAFDATVAPPGQHIVQVLGGHVPYRLRGRDWDDAAREELYQTVVRQICRYAPGFDKEVVHKQILTPPDIERIFAMPGGHVHHGEMSLDQVFFRRPFAHYADYRTPIRGLYMCGASNHPGGGVSGVPGHNAAREILKDMGRKYSALATVRP